MQCEKACTKITAHTGHPWFETSARISYRLPPQSKVRNHVRRQQTMQIIRIIHNSNRVLGCLGPLGPVLALHDRLQITYPRNVQNHDVQEEQIIQIPSLRNECNIYRSNMIYLLSVYSIHIFLSPRRSTGSGSRRSRERRWGQPLCLFRAVPSCRAVMKSTPHTTKEGD